MNLKAKRKILSSLKQGKRVESLAKWRLIKALKRITDSIAE